MARKKTATKAKTKKAGPTTKKKARKKTPAVMNIQEKVHDKIHQHTGLRRLSKYAVFAYLVHQLNFFRDAAGWAGF